MAAARAGVPLHTLQMGKATPDEYERFSKSVTDLYEMPICIDDSTAPTTESMFRKLDEMGVPVGCMIFDFLELGGDRAEGNEERRISKITIALRDIAKSLDIPVIALSQLSRKVEDRNNKMPTLADLRYSGQIEQSSDVVLFLMTPEYYAIRGDTIDCKPEDREGVCNNCGRENMQLTGRGDCRTCERWRHKHGTPRPASKSIRQYGAPPPYCTNCREEPIIAKGLCQACYNYRNRNGRSRPKYFIHRRCVECGRPLPRGNSYMSAGRCNTCCHWHYEKRQRRPQHLIAAAAPLRWCECGEAATVIVHDSVGGTTTDMPLCAHCLDAELEMETGSVIVAANVRKFEMPGNSLGSVGYA